MSVSQLLLEHLHQLDDGLLAAAFKANVLEIVRDLEDRPADDRARTLTLTLTFEPEQNRGDLDRVKLEHKVTSKIPGREGRQCILTPRKIGKDMHLQFAAVGTDARQPNLDFESGE